MEVVTLLPAVASRPRKDMELGAPVSEGSIGRDRQLFCGVFEIPAGQSSPSYLSKRSWPRGV